MGRRFAYGLCALLCACGAHNDEDTRLPNDAVLGNDGGSGSTSDSSDGGSSGGAGGTSDAGPSSGNGDAALPHNVGSCSGLGSTNQWEDISPAGMILSPPYTGALVPMVDPQNSGTVYVTTALSGIFKSIDCGATWTKTNTGRNGDQIDMGQVWSAAIDPVNPQILYVLTGYGPSGLWKSTNGGVDWDNVLPTNLGMPGFVGRVAMDPTNHLHLLLSFHNNCTGGRAPVCFGETKDGGMTWNVLDFPTSLASAWGEGMYLLPIDAAHWILEFWDIFYTSDAGSTWTLVTPGGKGAAGSIQGDYFRTPDGTFYLPAQFGVISSPDGQNWTMSGSGASGVDVLIGDGIRLFALQGFQPPSGSNFAFSAIYTQATNWSTLATPGLGTLVSGASAMAYDADHGLLYSAIQANGLYRTVTRSTSSNGGTGLADAGM